jgi:hypothetical protein
MSASGRLTTQRVLSTQSGHVLWPDQRLWRTSAEGSFENKILLSKLRLGKAPEQIAGSLGFVKTNRTFEFGEF